MAVEGVCAAIIRQDHLSQWRKFTVCLFTYVSASVSGVVQRFQQLEPHILGIYAITMSMKTSSQYLQSLLLNN